MLTSKQNKKKTNTKVYSWTFKRRVIFLANLGTIATLHSI